MLQNIIGNNLITPGGGYDSVILADNPAGYWKFDEGSGSILTDEIGGNHLTVSGTPQLDQPGIVTDGGRAVRFDALGDYARRAGGTTGLNVGPSTSIEAWVRTNGTPAGNFYTIAQFTLSGTPIRYVGVGYQLSSNRFYCWCRDDSNTINQDKSSAVVATGTNDYHVLATISAGGVVDLYINGVLDNATSGARAVVSLPAASFNVGANASGTGADFTIDNVAYYNSQLSAARVAAHYAAGTA